jgi:capsule polysaccharide export protein KpsC/LpsZ
MTNQEASKIIKDGMEDMSLDFADEEQYEALTMAIKALEQEPKTGHWIDADGDNAICDCCNRLNHLYGTYCKHCGAKMVEPQERSDKE